MTDVRMPNGFKAAGKALWKASTTEFEWADHELALLEEACRTRDRIRDLDKAVEADGIMSVTSQGSRVHPAIAESRQQRLVLARLLATMQIPGLDDDIPASRGVRGVYGGRRG